jgi:hypothetical protein
MSRWRPISGIDSISPIRGTIQRVRLGLLACSLARRHSLKLSGESCFHMAGCRGSLLLNLYATSFLFVVSIASDVRGRV